MLLGEPMKRNRFTLLLTGAIFSVIVIVAFFFGWQPSESETTPKKSAFKGFAIIVEVSGANLHDKNEIESYLKSELRRLGDVEINKEYATHYLFIKAIYTDVGVMAISYVFAENQVTELIYKGHDLVVYNSNWNKLSDVCKNIIVAIDVYFLEPIREGK